MEGTGLGTTSHDKRIAATRLDKGQVAIRAAKNGYKMKGDGYKMRALGHGLAAVSVC